jgi:hypothetical protein
MAIKGQLVETQLITNYTINPSTRYIVSIAGKSSRAKCDHWCLIAGQWISVWDKLIFGSKNASSSSNEWDLSSEFRLNETKSVNISTELQNQPNRITVGLPFKTRKLVKGHVIKVVSQAGSNTPYVYCAFCFNNKWNVCEQHRLDGV